MRVKAKTSPTGYVATLTEGEHSVEFPVIRFDEQGHALISDPDGHLRRASDFSSFEDVWPIGGTR